jgi:hypothetical protein
MQIASSTDDQAGFTTTKRTHTYGIDNGIQ